MPVGCRTKWRSDHGDAPVPGCPVSNTRFILVPDHVCGAATSNEACRCTTLLLEHGPSSFCRDRKAGEARPPPSSST